MLLALAACADPPPPSDRDAAWTVADAHAPTVQVRWEEDTLVAASDGHELRFAPDGEVTVGAPSVDRSADLPVAGADAGQVWFTRTDGTLARLPIPNAVALAASPRHLAVVSADLGVVLVDLASGGIVRTLLPPGEPRARTASVAFSADGARLGYASIDVRAWRVADGAELFRGPQREWITSLAVHPDGSAVAACTRSGAAMRMEVGDPVPRELATHLGEGCEVWFDGDRVVVSAPDRATVAVFEADGTPRSVAAPWVRGLGGLWPWPVRTGVPTGVVAWTGAGDRLSWTAGGTIRDAEWLGPVERVVPHPAGGLVIASGGVVRVVSRATLEQRSVEGQPAAAP